MIVAAAEALEIKPDLFWLAACAVLGMACGYSIGRLVSSARADWDMRGVGAVLGLLVGLALYGVGTRAGG